MSLGPVERVKGPVSVTIQAADVPTPTNARERTHYADRKLAPIFEHHLGRPADPMTAACIEQDIRAAYALSAEHAAEFDPAMVMAYGALAVLPGNMFPFALFSGVDPDSAWAHRADLRWDHAGCVFLYDVRRERFHVRDRVTFPMTVADFQQRTGRPPSDDVLTRVNCDVTGEIGHWNCGWCILDDGPQSVCLCALAARETTEQA